MAVRQLSAHGRGDAASGDGVPGPFQQVREPKQYRYDSSIAPDLAWDEQAERREISVPTVPPFMHERRSTRAILEKLQNFKAAGQMDNLFGDPQLDIADRMATYEYKGPRLRGNGRPSPSEWEPW